MWPALSVLRVHYDYRISNCTVPTQNGTITTQPTRPNYARANRPLLGSGTWTCNSTKYPFPFRTNGICPADDGAWREREGESSKLMVGSDCFLLRRSTACAIPHSLHRTHTTRVCPGLPFSKPFTTPLLMRLGVWEALRGQSNFFFA